VRLGHWIGLLALVLSLLIIWQIRQIALLGFAAVVLATVLNGVVRSLQRFRIQRGSAIAITVILLVAFIVGFFALIVPSLIEQLQQFIRLIPEAIEQVRGWLTQLIDRIPGQVLENAPNLNNFTQQLQTWLSQLFGNFVNLVNTSVTAIISFFLFLVITIMLLLNPLPYRRVFVLAFPAFYRRRVEEILDQCEAALSGWIKGTLLNMLIVAFLSYVGLLILGVPLPLVNALLAGLLEFIPNVGPTLSTVPPVLLALLDAPWKAVAVIVLYFFIQQIESFLLVPIVMSQAVDLLPVFTILAVLVFASFFGFLGLFMSIPLLIVSQIWLKEVLVKDVLDRWQDKTKYNREKILIVENDNRSTQVRSQESGASIQEGERE
jgi:predicted PurR-regulated permease PerM